MRAAVVLTVLASLTAAGAEPDFSEVRKLVRENVEGAVPSVTIAVVRDGRILWEEGFGWADREQRVPATVQTMYYTASVAKTFTATALMMLHERKRLDLDRPVNDYLGPAKLSSPAFDPAGATIRRVATHTAGLTTFNPTTTFPMADQIRRFGILFWPPGERFDYSNLGPLILEQVVERVSRQSYRDFVREQIFRPLGMTHASAESDRNLARRYSAAGGTVPRSDSGVYCSAHDLAKFAMFHLKAHRSGQKPVLTDASIDAMRNETVAAGSRRYGLGWWIYDGWFRSQSVVANGGTLSDQAWVWLVPDQRIAVVVLSNFGNLNVGRIIDAAVGALVPDAKDPHAVEPPASAAVSSFDSLMGGWAGFVRTNKGDVPLSLSVRGAEIHVKLGEQPETTLNQARFRDGRLSGVMPGDAGVSGATALKLSLYLRDGVFKGAAVTDPSPQLPHWVEVRRTVAGR